MNRAHDFKPEIAVAPMMDWTDRHCRYFHRLLAPSVRLYTEMITTGALLHGDRERFLRFDPAEHPVALQLGGSEPDELAACAVMGAKAGYDEINLNCGCPSDRVQSGRFGACLMKEPEHVAACVKTMCSSVDIPVTVKCRIGIDKENDFAFLDKFVDKIAQAGCRTFIIHARNAWLKGLSPKENREVPPLDYGRAAAIKEKYPQLRIILNGGIKDIETVHDHLKTFNGVMIGREAYQNPLFLRELETGISGTDNLKAIEQVILEMTAYAKAQKEQFGTPVKSITRHMLGLFHNQPGARQWRRSLSTWPYEGDVDENIILKAFEIIQEKQKIAA